MNRLYHLAAFSLALLAGGCNFPDSSAETEELQDKIDQLKSERRPGMGEEDQALRAELAAAREQLQIALVALEMAQEGKPEDAAGAVDPVDIEIEGAPRAIAVEEDPSVELAAEMADVEPVAALLDAKDHQVFFAELSKFGEWFETTEFGFVWQPAELKTDPNWRPYTRGRWVHSDQGWTWLSDEPFGWAVYHYGRWALLEQFGWVWIPGDDWAPAWVAWRQNDDYLGWAPLPPETLYDDDFSYDPGIDLAYDIAPDYYNFVPLEFFPEPVLPYCVPRARVVTIVINTVNVTRFSTRHNRVHCGGPDLAWVNRHVRKKIPHCRLNLGHGRERFAGRARPQLRGDRLDVFAPQVGAPWNPAVCPSRVSGHLGRVEVVRGKGTMSQEVRHRHQRAIVQRQVAARAALQTDECHRALRRNLERRRLAQRGGGDERRTPGERRAVAEQALRTAMESAQSTQRRSQEPNLNPKQRAYAQLAAKNAEKDLHRAREAHAATLPPRKSGDGPAVADRPPREERRGNQQAALAAQAPPEGKKEPRANRSDLNPTPRRDAEIAARSVERRKAADQAAVQKAVGQAASEKAVAAERARVAERKRQAQVEEERKQEEALAAARAKVEAAKRRTQASQLNSKQRKDAEMAERDAERQRQAAEKAAAQRRLAAAEQRRKAEAEESNERARVASAKKQREAAAAERARMAAQQEQAAQEEDARRAENSRRELLARQRAEEEARQAKQKTLAREQARQEDLQRQQAAAERSRRAAEQQALAEKARQAEAARQRDDVERQRRSAAEAEQRAAALRAQRQAEARRQADDARREAVAKQQAESARRAAQARQQQAADERRRAAAESQRAAELRARADAARQARAAQIQAERAAQQRAAEQAARRQAEAQQRRAAEQAARARQEAQQRRAAEAQAKAEAARRQQAEQQRRQVESRRQQSQQRQRGRRK